MENENEFQGRRKEQVDYHLVVAGTCFALLFVAAIIMFIMGK
jgi:hypothetical protein